MVASVERITPLAVVEVPLKLIKVSTRLRGTDEDKVTDLAESIEGIGLLHQITVSKHGEWFHLLDGMHRLEAFRKLGRDTIPASINQSDPLIEELIEVEANLVSAKLTSIDEARFIVRWEEILTSLGKKAIHGDNRWNRSGLTNEDLARTRGMSKRNYQYTKTIANLHPEVQDLLNETSFANNKTDLIALVKESDEVQMEVARLLITGKCNAFKRALELARCKIFAFNWDEEKARLREQIGKPYSVMKWNGDSSPLSRLCKLVSHQDECRVEKRSWGTFESPNSSQHPDHSAYFINYYSKEGDTIADVMAGRGTNLLVGAALGRKVVGYDLSSQNLEAVRSACLEHTEIAPVDLVLHNSDGVQLKEYEGQESIWDLVTFDPPYILNAENYGEDPRDLCKIKDLEEFNAKLEECLLNLKRLVKQSSFAEKRFHPIVIKVGSARRGENGLIDMATEVEIIARRIGLILHDKVINVLDSQWGMFNVSRCINNRYSVKIHETNLVFLKYS
ncbi:ParB N-terminal domain-containing protein [Synechococcus sp. UW140]|uniref:ParB/RepB/Spo0J family partition protein n=1 Tax=Synechococcus sp. UW140 TaxID=368503 RepID=UPI0031378D9D